jgi:hypothetical protein
MKLCKKCNQDRTKDVQKAHKELCLSCYRKQEREIVFQRDDKICTVCDTKSSVKWYRGPVCRPCYRNNLYDKEKIIKSDKYIDTRIKNNLRSRISKIVSGVVKQGSAVNDLGCSIEYFMSHIESKFKPGMTWDNYGHSVWHIDHIKPLNSFNLQDSEELKKACHYTNLQPLWAKDNLQKSDKWPK